MSRQVFISFLGTSDYSSVQYQLGAYCSQPVLFVQEALIEAVCRNWTSQDAIIICCTPDSTTRNWENRIVANNEQNGATNSTVRIGLHEQLRRMEGLRPSVTRLDITAGFTENDIWSIFDSVYGALQDMDEIYLDVTHAFRSIPLFSIPLFNFAKFMKQTRLVAIYYGAFEARQNQIAPIVDLTSLVKLQATNVAASNFVDFGKVGSLNIAIDENHLNEAGQEVIHAVQDVKRQLEALDYYIQTCNMNRLRQGEYYRVIHERIDTVCGSPHVREAETLLLRKMLAELDAFHFTCEASDCNVVGAIKWAIKYNMIQQAYTLGEEYMINRVAIYIRKGFSELDIDSGIAQNAEARREFAGNVLAAPANRNFRITQTRYQVGNADRNELEAYGQRLLSDRHIATVRMSYNQIRDNRNQLNHANGLEARNVNQAPAVVMGRLKEQLNLTIDMFNQFPLNG